MAARRLDLLAPALLAHFPFPAHEAPRAPVLERMLGRGNRLAAAAADPLGTLFERFGIPMGPDADIPSAPFCRLADCPGSDPEGFWLHADPVYLRADRDRLLLFDSRPLAITRDEASALVALFNAHFAGEGLRLEAPVPGRWYLRAAERHGIRTRPLHAAVGRSIHAALPKGPDAGWWNDLLNEVQMLFHQSAVNRYREQAGRPLVNGIWVWGGGHASGLRPHTDLVAVHADYPLARGLAAATGVSASSLSVEPVAAAGEGAVLVFWDRLWPAALDGDSAVWAGELARLNAWSAGLLGSLGRRHFRQIDLYPCEGSLSRITPAGMRRFWRRPFGLGRG